VENGVVRRSHVTIDLAAIRHNAAVLTGLLERTELWAVVKADGYGHGALDVARTVLDHGAAALCVATVGEALALRTELPDVRLIVLGPTQPEDVPVARDASLELTMHDERLPEGVPIHLKLDTGMGRWGLSELPVPGPSVVGLMTHFATAGTDQRFVHEQLEQFLRATEAYAGIFVRHVANSAAALMLAETRLDAARCGIALYGIDPFGEDPRRFGLRPALRWESHVAQVRRLAPGESTGYDRLFVAAEETWIAIVPIGYADGFRRDLTGTALLVAGSLSPVVGAVSMDAVAVTLTGPVEVGAPVTLVGDGITLEDHARVADTIAYELACDIRLLPGRSSRVVIGV
jgi:alanine racemase